MTKVKRGAAPTFGWVVRPDSGPTAPVWEAPDGRTFGPYPKGYIPTVVKHGIGPAVPTCSGPVAMQIVAAEERRRAGR